MNYYLKQEILLNSHLNSNKSKHHPAQLAQKALLKEICLSPKPGLVDMNNNGSHSDMNFDTFIESIKGISLWLDEFYQYGQAFDSNNKQDFLIGIRPLGILCEKAMFNATNNVNTHKGGIFAFGLLLGAIGKLKKENKIVNYLTICSEVSSVCQGLVDKELVTLNSVTNSSMTKPISTMGEKLFIQYKLTGARGEAESGYSTVRDISLPVFNEMLTQEFDEETSLLQTMLYLLAYNNDTNLVSRGGIEGLHFVQESARTIISLGGMHHKNGRDYLQKLDQELIKRHLSPGGTADLIAITWFLSQYKN